MLYFLLFLIRRRLSFLKTFLVKFMIYWTNRHAFGQAYICQVQLTTVIDGCSHSVEEKCTFINDCEQTYDTAPHEWLKLYCEIIKTLKLFLKSYMTPTEWNRNNIQCLCQINLRKGKVLRNHSMHGNNSSLGFIEAVL